MDLVYYFAASWLVVAYLVTHIRKNEIVRSIILYFIFTMISVCIASLISINYQLIHYSEDGSKNLSLLLNRNIIAPCTTVIFINLCHRSATYMKYMLVPLPIILIGFMEFISLKIQINTYQGWVFIFVLMFYTASVFTTALASKFIVTIQLRGDDR